jgi:hypothetical protein
MTKNTSRSIARKRYWNEHDKSRYECPDCGRSEEQIHGTFEVHHQNGNAYDNRLENLIAVCGLCHAIRENRKPGGAVIQTALRELKTRQSTESDSNRTRKLADWVQYKLQRNYPTTRRYGSRLDKTVHGSLGFEKDDLLNCTITPRTRREAALFRAGKHATAKKIHENTSDALDQARKSGKCEMCGLTERQADRYEDTQLKLHTEPTDYGNLDERHVLCSDCLKDVLDGLRGGSHSDQDVLKEIESRLGGDKKAEETLNKSKSNWEKQLDICHKNIRSCQVEACASDADYIYQLDDHPTSAPVADSARDITLLWSGICDEHVQEIQEQFDEGAIVAPVDAFYSYILREESGESPGAKAPADD